MQEKIIGKPNRSIYVNIIVKLASNGNDILQKLSQYMKKIVIVTLHCITMKSAGPNILVPRTRVLTEVI